LSGLQKLHVLSKYTINNLGHRRLFLATLPYFEWMLCIYIAIDGREYDTPLNTKKKPDAGCNTKRFFPKLKPKRISVERDDRSKIQQVIYID